MRNDYSLPTAASVICKALRAHIEARHHVLGEVPHISEVLLYGEMIGAAPATCVAQRNRYKRNLKDGLIESFKGDKK